MLKLMRAPAKYVQGKDAFLEVYENIKDLGSSVLFVCSNSGYKACKDKIEKSFEGAGKQLVFEVFNKECCKSEIQRLMAAAKEKYGVGSKEYNDIVSAVLRQR